MGCGESKHVVTGNTISQKASRAGSRRGKTSETIEETSKNGSKTSSIMMKEEGKTVIQDSGRDNSKAAADVKNIAESKELKKEENVENEEAVEGIAFEGISGRSVYYSPQGEVAKKESLSNENVKVAVALENKELAQETKMETNNENVEDIALAEETKEETAKGEPETVKEEKLVKETETAETTQAKVSIPTENKVKESAVSPAAEDLKTE